MSQQPTQERIEELLRGLQNPEAKRRESTAKSIANLKIDDPRILNALESLADKDPVAYVKEAAGLALHALGYILPKESVPSPKPIQEEKIETKNLKCPRCDKDDMIQKVTAIVAGQTHNVSGTSLASQIYIDKDGSKHYETYSAPYSGMQTSVLAQRLAPPTQPYVESTSDQKFVGLVLMGIGGLMCFSWLMTIPLIFMFQIPSLPSPPYSTSELNAIFQNVVSFSIVIGIGPFLLISGIALIGNAIGKDKRRRVQVETEMPRWEQAMRRWNQLYYCFRDDIVFVPGENTSTPTSAWN